ncbi:TonB-dependent receptor domain-containing protein [Oricola thermophila]|uniref:TonB-dependent receptor n=1 Tax=Oricola thermophila TaxID=2742145 RepID=A0A6N1VDW7_9HYPH|nr:TonB-dependent receptor [Oricola thermophila]QKV17237.1 TonB-dependent receptor [Oricola thermophila]
MVSDSTTLPTVGTVSTTSRRVAFAAALAASSALAGPPAALAQETAEQLPVLVITASGSEIDLRDVPASVTVISEEEIEDMPAQDVRDLLSRVEGITLARSGNANKVQIRGLGERYTLFMVDGKRVNSAPNLFRGNDFDSGWVPLDAIERIEVVRGPMSSLHGSDAIGGVINIITRKDYDAWHGSVTTEFTAQEDPDAGDYGRVGFHASGPIAENLGLRIYGAWDRRNPDNPTINPDSSLDGFLLSDNKFIDVTGSWMPDAFNTLELNYDFSRRVHNDVPMNRHAGSFRHVGEYDFGTTEVSLWGDRIRNEYGHGNKLGEDQPNTAYNAGADGKVVLPVEFWTEQTLTIGSSYRYQQIDDDYVLTGGGDPTSSVWQGAIFFEDELRITDDFLLTVGNRLDYHENFGAHNSPRIYGVYHLTEGLTIKGGWSSAFKAPTLLENSPNWYQISCGGGCYLAGSDELDPETSRSIEVGIHYEGPAWSAGVTAFRNDIEDMIPFPPARTSDVSAAPTYSNFVGFAPGGEPVFAYENIEEARTQGVEATISVRPHPDWTFTANYTYLDAKNLTIDAPIAYQPEHNANFTAEWQATDKLNLAVNVSYVGEQYTYVPPTGDMAYASAADAFVTADVMAKYDFNENFTIRAGVLNIADHQVTRETIDDFNIDGRRFFLSATGRF